MRYIPCGQARGPSLGYDPPRRRSARRRLLLPVALAVFLVGCGPGMERQHACRMEAGPRPYPLSEGFGLIGALVAESTSERQEWNQRVSACVHRAP